MKTLVTIITICFLSTISFGQKNLFYATIQDYYNKKPIDGYEIEDGGYSEGTFGTTIKIKKGTERIKTSPSDLPSEFFTYASIYTYPKFIDCLMRSYKGDIYMVLVDGPLCFYTKFQYLEKQYYSETISGDLKKYSRNFLEKHLKDYDLLESYKSDRPKIQVNTTAEERINNNLQHDAKYFNIINSKIKK